MIYNFDKNIYSRQEHNRLQDILGAVSAAAILQQATDEFSYGKGSAHFRYALLLIAANFSASLFRYEEALNLLKQADRLFPPGEVEQTIYYLVLGRIAKETRAYDRALEIYNRQLAREDLSIEERGFFLLDICSAHRGRGAIKEALETALELRELWKQSREHRLNMARAEHNVGNLYGEMGKWEESLSHIEAALELYRQLGDINGQARVHNGIGVYFFMSSAYEIAIESYTASEQLYVSLGNQQRALSVRGNIAFCYYELGRYSEAIQLMNTVAEGYRELGDLHNFTRASVNLALILLGADIPAAEQVVMREEIQPHLDVIMQGAQALVLATAARERGEYDKSVELARKTLMMCEQTGYDQYRQQALELLAYGLRQQGDAEGAYDYQLRAYEHARDQHRRQIEAQRRALTLKLERERIEHERVLLRAEVEQKQKEITATTLKLVERSQLMGLVTQRLRDLRARVSDKNKSLVSQTLALIESQTGNVWEAFEQSLDELTNQFFQVLAERHPDLSPTEQRIAGLLRAGMSTKEIALAMHVSTRTVETHRYRLRKKLSHAGVADMLVYLQHITVDKEGDGMHYIDMPASSAA